MLKNLLLRKGWAGKTISRAETVERLNPIIRRLIRLNHNHDAFIRSGLDGSLGAGLAVLQKTARTDVGKLAESVYSCGGTAYNGTDLDPSDFSVADDRDKAIESLADMERSFIELLSGESKIEHHMRTRAILAVVKENAKARLEALAAATR